MEYKSIKAYAMLSHGLKKPDLLDQVMIDAALKEIKLREQFQTSCYLSPNHKHFHHIMPENAKAIEGHIKWIAQLKLLVQEASSKLSNLVTKHESKVSEVHEQSNQAFDYNILEVYEHDIKYATTDYLVVKTIPSVPEETDEDVLNKLIDEQDESLARFAQKREALKDVVVPMVENVRMTNELYGMYRKAARTIDELGVNIINPISFALLSKQLLYILTYLSKDTHTQLLLMSIANKTSKTIPITHRGAYNLLTNTTEEGYHIYCSLLAKCCISQIPRLYNFGMTALFAMTRITKEFEPTKVLQHQLTHIVEVRNSLLYLGKGLIVTMIRNEEPDLDLTRDIMRGTFPLQWVSDILIRTCVSFLKHAEPLTMKKLYNNKPFQDCDIIRYLMSGRQNNKVNLDITP